MFEMQYGHFPIECYCIDNALSFQHEAGPCLDEEACRSAPLTSISLSPAICSSTVNITITGTCDESQIVDVGFKHVNIWAWNM